MRNLLSVILVTLALGACAPGNECSTFVDLAAGGWAYGDSVVFTPAMADSVADGHLKIAVCHDNSYPWSNLWLEVSYPGPQGTYRDTVEMTLADPFGHWQGKAIGSTYQMQATLPARLRLHADTRVEVRHIMRLDTLRGLTKVGVTFTPD